VWTRICVANRTSTFGRVIALSAYCARPHAASCRHNRSDYGRLRGIAALALTAALSLALAPTMARAQSDTDTPSAEHVQRTTGTVVLGAKSKYKTARNEKGRKGKVRASKEPFASMPKGPLQIVISINQQRLHLYSDGTHVADATIATGVPSHPTPMGIFSVIQKQRFHRSNIYSGAPMPFMQRITWSGVAMHEGVNLGHPASHGCIRMPGDFAVRLFKLHSLGARVVIARADLQPQDFADTHLFVHKDKPPTPAPSPDPSAAAPVTTESTKTAQTVDASKATDAVPAPLPGASTTTASPLAAIAASNGAGGLQLKPADPEPAKSVDGKDPKAAPARGEIDASAAAGEVQRIAGATDTIARPGAPAAAATADGVPTGDASPVPAATGDAKPDTQGRGEAVEAPQAPTAAAINAKPDAEGNSNAIAAPPFDDIAPPVAPAAAPRDGVPSEEAIAAPAAAADAKPNNESSGEVVEVPKAPTDAATVPTTLIAPTAPATGAGTKPDQEPQAEPAPVAVPVPAAKPADIAGATPSNTTPITIFISRKTKRLYVRQNFAPLFEAPITIKDPDQPLGTHVFTALSYLTGGTMRWNVISLPSRMERKPEKKLERIGRHGRVREIEVLKPIVEPPTTPQDALARIEIPQDVIDQISEMIVPGSSLIVSDQGLGQETGEGTDFIVVTR
jgi:L,D-transpeptidase catalytic domain